MPRSRSCINKTATCWQVCYGRGIRYQSAGQKQKRERNFRTCESLLDAGGPQLLAENLALVVDQARPIDWIAACVTGEPTCIPWSFRIHDIGDFYSIEYVRAWRMVAQMRPHCRFWFYTRSFVDQSMFLELTKLAAEKNCRGWISIDKDNYCDGIMAYCRSNSKVWSLALLQEEESDMPPDLVPSLAELDSPGRVVSFPKHHGGRHVAAVKSESMTVCPQVLGAYPLQPKAHFARS